MMQLANLLIKKTFSGRNLDNPLDVCYSEMLSVILLKEQFKNQAEIVYMVKG